MGEVLDQSTGSPLSDVWVALWDTLGAELEGTFSDTAGMFALEPASGVYDVVVRHIGFAPGDYRVAIQEGQIARIVFVLAPWVVEIAGVEVTGERVAPLPAPMLQGFYRRKERGWGRFITREQIDQRQASRVTDLLRGQPGVRVTPYGQSRFYIQLSSKRCPPLVYVDNIPIGRAVDRTLDDFSPSDIEGIEIYRRASETPAEFGGSNAGCGIIAIWTRH